MLKTLSTSGNEPIKDYSVMRRSQPMSQGNSPSSAPYNPPASSYNNNNDDIAALLLGCGCPIILLLGIYSVVKASKNKK
jgi:hypothetical protein